MRISPGPGADRGRPKYPRITSPDDDLTAEFYETACARLNAAGIEQYEISTSRERDLIEHNDSTGPASHIWLRRGLRIPCAVHGTQPGADCLRFSSVDVYDRILAAPEISTTLISRAQALEEIYFGLRLNRGVDVAAFAIAVR